MGSVPWCEPCDRFLSPSTVRTDGTCPECGRAVDPGRAHAPADPVSIRGAPTPSAPSPPASTATPTPAPAPSSAPSPTNIYGEPIDDDEKVPLPWHLKLLAGALAVYLGYRFLQGVEWVFGK